MAYLLMSNKWPYEVVDFDVWGRRFWFEKLYKHDYMTQNRLSTC